MENNEEGTTVEAVGKIAVGGGIMMAIDYFFGDVWLIVLLAIGIYSTSYATKLSVSGLQDMLAKTNRNGTKEKIQRWWYEANVPPHSEDRMANPTAEQIAEYIAWREEQERIEKEKSTSDSATA